MCAALGIIGRGTWDLYAGAVLTVSVHARGISTTAESLATSLFMLTPVRAWHCMPQMAAGDAALDRGIGASVHAPARRGRVAVESANVRDHVTATATVIGGGAAVPATRSTLLISRLHGFCPIRLPFEIKPSLRVNRN